MVEKLKKGSITLTCGHISESYVLDEENHIAIKSQDRGGNNAIDYMTVCNRCKEYYEKKELILYTEEDKNVYFGGILKSNENNIESEIDEEKFNELTDYMIAKKELYEKQSQESQNSLSNLFTRFVKFY